MPVLALLDLLVAVFLMNHVRATGRPPYWYAIILGVPVVGPIAYVCFEIIPEMGNARRSRPVSHSVADIIAPHREFERLANEAKTTDSAAAKQALAEECERKSMWKDAIQLYKSAAQGMYADDPKLLIGLARAHLGNATAQSALATLDRLRTAHPEYHDQDAHLLYARCLEELGRNREAEADYAELSNYYAGLEARTRYGLLLLKRGEHAKASELFNQVVRASQARGIVLSEADRVWLKVAKANI